MKTKVHKKIENDVLVKIELVSRETVFIVI